MGDKVENLIIAVDGPAAAGKSTVSKRAAEKMDLLYVDTGAMYRAVTLQALRKGLDPEKCCEIRLVEVASDADLSFAGGCGVPRILLNGEDVSLQIRNPRVDAKVSFVAQVAGVREQLVQLQREIAQERPSIVEGRDICTNVLPCAPVKIYLTASFDERARRRWKQLGEQGYCLSLQQVRDRLAERDEIDTKRQVNPLRRHEDAVLIDSTDLEIAEVVARVVNLGRQFYQ